ncbi:hypothetical protein yc1106_01291 [Curvularia clavata]|uniref:Uncharacterized protein n=1 Tax=Curvularia clavata TaxID=95742 RepID=A0A9Q9DNZ9_CURCL|nr:hypothetical protein yc1106_01291 [Curvularia clavata]
MWSIDQTPKDREALLVPEGGSSAVVRLRSHGTGRSLTQIRGYQQRSDDGRLAPSTTNLLTRCSPAPEQDTRCGSCLALFKTWASPQDAGLGPPLRQAGGFSDSKAAALRRGRTSAHDDERWDFLGAARGQTSGLKEEKKRPRPRILRRQISRFPLYRVISPTEE